MFYTIIQKGQGIGAALLLLGLLVIAISSILVDTNNSEIYVGSKVNIIGVIAIIIGLFIGLICSVIDHIMLSKTKEDCDLPKN